MSSPTPRGSGVAHLTQNSWIEGRQLFSVCVQTVLKTSFSRRRRRREAQSQAPQAAERGSQRRAHCSWGARERGACHRLARPDESVREGRLTQGVKTPIVLRGPHGKRGIPKSGTFDNPPSDDSCDSLRNTAQHLLSSDHNGASICNTCFEVLAPGAKTDSDQYGCLLVS